MPPLDSTPMVAGPVGASDEVQDRAHCVRPGEAGRGRPASVVVLPSASLLGGPPQTMQAA